MSTLRREYVKDFQNIVFNTPLPSIHFIWSNTSFDWDNNRQRAPLFSLQVPTEANDYFEVYIISFQVIIHVIFYFEKQNKTMNKQKPKPKSKTKKQEKMENTDIQKRYHAYLSVLP